MGMARAVLDYEHTGNQPPIPSDTKPQRLEKKEYDSAYAAPHLQSAKWRKKHNSTLVFFCLFLFLLAFLRAPARQYFVHPKKKTPEEEENTN